MGEGGGVLFRPFRAVSCGHPSTAQRWRCGPVPATYYLVPGRRLMRCMEHAGKRNKTQRKTTAKPATDPSIWPMAPPHATAPSPRPRRRRPNLSSLTTAVRLVFKRDLFRTLLRFFSLRSSFRSFCFFSLPCLSKSCPFFPDFTSISIVFSCSYSFLTGSGRHLLPLCHLGSDVDEKFFPTTAFPSVIPSRCELE